MKISFQSVYTAALCATTLCTLTAFTSAQSTWFVDDDASLDPAPGNPFISDPLEDGSSSHPFDRVQEAIDIAGSGDSVVVSSGTYFLLDTLNLSGGTAGSKDLHIRSVSGAVNTVIDAIGIEASAVRADSGESAACVLEGFTVINGQGSLGAGNDQGGGLYIDGSSPTIRACKFASNVASVGAGAYVNNSSSRFENCAFELNTASSQGAGLYVNNSPLLIDRCRFEMNTAVSNGAGLVSRASTAANTLMIQDSVFLGNQVTSTSTSSLGGGLYKRDNHSLQVDRCRFLSNSAGEAGGGAWIDGGANFSSCTFNSNSAIWGGGVGVTGTDGETRVHGSTLVNNSGGGFAEEVGVVVFGFVKSSIVWNNSGDQLSAQVSVDYCNVLGGYVGSGNIDVDPQFRDALGADGVAGTLDDRLSLLRTSPCVDAGDTFLYQSAYPLDMRGAPRAVDVPDSADTGRTLLGLTTDMGAFEFQPPSLRQIQSL